MVQQLTSAAGLPTNDGDRTVEDIQTPACLELTIYVDHKSHQLVEEILIGCGALAVTAEDAWADTAWEQPIFSSGELPPQNSWQRSKLTAFFDCNADPDSILGCLNDHKHDLGLVVEDPRFKTISPQDWVKLAQDQFQPIKIGKKIWIVPSWCTPPEQDDCVNIFLDPGAAFGTGAHATTQMCLAWIEQHARPGLSCLDIGCGSGILAIAASIFGCQPCYAMDIDPYAVAATIENATKNSAQVDVWLAGDRPLPTADLVIANILAQPLIDMADGVVAAMNPGATLILTGILEDQFAALKEAYFEASDGSVQLHIENTQEGWALLKATKMR